MKTLFKIKSLALTLLRLFYSLLSGGEKCIICGNLSYLLPLCPECRKLFTIEEIKRCKCCGKELISENELCMECRENPVLKNVDGTFPLFSYRLWNKELLFLWKIQGIRALSYFFAGLVFKALKQLQLEYLVPVPPRPGKIRKNGWDQIDELCKILKYHYGIKVLPLLERISSTQQKKLNRDERLSTIKSAYVFSNKALLNLPQKLCIIDDVCTTGATLETCAQIIKANTSVEKVYAMTLFAVD